MKRFLGSQGFVTLAGVTLVAVLAIVGYLFAFDPMRKTLAYCAIMPDGVGLYAGNHVTTLGIPVGTITSVRPEKDSVRVTFTVDADHPLRGDVIATTVSDTLVADRTLSVLGDDDSPARWNQDTCLTKTFTPKSITETLEAFSGLADQLTDHGDPAERQRIRDSLRTFRDATTGEGGQMNRLVLDLGTALRQPDAAIGHIGGLVDSFAALVGSISANWGDIKTALVQAAPGIAFINDIWQRVVQLVDSLLVILPWFNDIARRYGRPILEGIDELTPSLRMLSANVGTLQQIIDMVPSLVTAFGQSIDPQTGHARLTYTPPTVALPQDTADQVCAAVNATMPGRCRTAANGMADVDLAPLVLGLAGAR
ncbi:MCE family protein [Nocardia uniformis]|uniref:MCE family protein n=1 Tax=Nocardia uniformis TaxID=53432 RepID=A0A849C1X3_9NOCA|nr:MlaD family protein [Nocardia uniformis]NNH72743.1 MCE family protein [Nocardia uniformis]